MFLLNSKIFFRRKNRAEKCKRNCKIIIAFYYCEARNLKNGKQCQTEKNGKQKKILSRGWEKVCKFSLLYEWGEGWRSATPQLVR